MTSGRIALAGAVFIVVAAVIAGLVISGSPARQRMLRLDDRRLDDLQRISRSIERYYRETEAVPTDLDVLVNGWISAGLPRDPETDDDYDYEVETGYRYQLCADFALASRETEASGFWSHEPGYQCFSIDYSDVRLDRF